MSDVEFVRILPHIVWCVCVRRWDECEAVAVLCDVNGKVGGADGESRLIAYPTSDRDSTLARAAPLEWTGGH